MTVFDTEAQKIVGNVKELKHVHGVLAVPVPAIIQPSEGVINRMKTMYCVWSNL